ncbi:MAG: hypothetical protein QNJ87_01640 [Gammaproteobacteria bacterium]|nr:hypothetical protein [Gammaproteobacteria bacterium]MDJ0892032.1 hypothetical protein [Gammaproteobacteria bacterium]
MINESSLRLLESRFEVSTTSGVITGPKPRSGQRVEIHGKLSRHRFTAAKPAPEDP